MSEAPKDKDQDEEFDDAEIARRRDEVVRRMLNTPPQPKHVKPKGKPNTTKKGKPAK